jgi:hypothetical protein
MGKQVILTQAPTTTTVLSIFCLLVRGRSSCDPALAFFETARFHGRVDRILASST